MTELQDRARPSTEGGRWLLEEAADTGLDLDEPPWAGQPQSLHAPLILRLDVTGQPVRWIPWHAAVTLDAREMIAWRAGEHDFTFYGGRSRMTGEQSHVTVNSIVAVKGRLREVDISKSVPPLSNRELFRRDSQMCMYCGSTAASGRDGMLTRDHVVPISQGGRDNWQNVVTACRPCNHAKGGRTPEEANMPLLAVPFVPNRAEYLVLSNRRILADQMEFLRKRFRNSNRLRVGPFG